MKVLHTEWSDGWGGQEIRIINEMIAVREKGIEVFLACRDNAKIKEKALENNIKVFILPFRGNVDFKTMFALMKIVKENTIDIINTHSGKDTWVGGIAAKLSGAKFIRTRHLSNKIRSGRLNFINELADYIFTTGESVKDDMIKYNRINPSKIKSIPTGIDSDLFNINNFDILNNRKKYGLSDNEIAIGIIAVLREFKRHETFIEMAKIVKSKHENVKFFIAGDGPRRFIIEDLIKKYKLEDNVILLGHINNPEELLSVLDIFVLTSDSKEGVPQSVNQALMMNTAVIATNVGSTKDLKNNDNFFLVEPNDISAIANHVNTLIQDKETLSNYKINSRDYVVNKYSKISMRDEIIEIYKKILEK
ncbi:glycosyltransferase [Poseidonibacter lekithochrous]|uniref:glycosyltransferase n=1 Tax=Poseidonibacter lekithochrous TaxID=1904463 RepID=UPI0008FC51BE|nr:glycosyltransferase [Poseidonibacter lekithochrous]QKJ23780.1 glycosyltransferase, family 1 [Poseidonibacter lekithochrous]